MRRASGSVTPLRSRSSNIPTLRHPPPTPWPQYTCPQVFDKILSCVESDAISILFVLVSMTILIYRILTTMLLARHVCQAPWRRALIAVSTN